MRVPALRNVVAKYKAMAEGKVQPQIECFYVALRTFAGMYPTVTYQQHYLVLK